MSDNQGKPTRSGKVFGSIFKVRGWIDYDRLKSFTTYLVTGIKKMTVPQPPSVKNKSKSFNEMAAKMQLSEEELHKRYKGLYRLSLLMTAIAFAIFGYCLYQLYYLNFKAVIVSFIISLVALALAFRYHFWYFQIKERKLGYTFKEWYEKCLLRKK